MLLALGVAAVLVREVPAASNQLPSRALAIEGGGSEISERIKKTCTVRSEGKHLTCDLPVPAGKRITYKFRLEGWECK